jgi:fructosamine-3-kinase
VFKISPREGDAGIEREFAVLEYFAENSGMPVPRPFLIETHGKTIPGTVLVMSRVPGSVLHSAHGTLTRRDRAAVNRQITEHVLNLHESKLNGFGGVELSREDRHERWSDFWLPRFDRVMKEARESGVIESAFFERVDALRPSFEHWLSSVTEATLTHYDIWSGNVMVDRRDGEAYVSGFIDIPGFAADYAREISFMLMFGMADESFLRAYADRHGLDEDFALRVNMYNLKMHTKHITMYPSQYYYRQGAESCLRYLEEKQNAPT